MDDADVHTSVVIEVANQMDSTDRKTYHIDLDNVAASKDYVLDQIFCGENITVYALFEPMDDDEALPRDKQQYASLEPPCPCTGETEAALNDDNGNSKQTAYLNYKNSYREDEMVSQKIGRRDRSFCVHNHCEEGLGVVHPGTKYYDEDEDDEDCREYHGEYHEDYDMKVLYRKESRVAADRTTGQSRGVNTDIALSPKLLDEVQNAITMKFSSPTCPDDQAQRYSLDKCHGSQQQQRREECAVTESTTQLGPNFLLVPLIMMEEGMLTQVTKKNAWACEICEKMSKADTVDASVTYNEKIVCKCECDNRFHSRIDCKDARIVDSESQASVTSGQTLMDEIRDVQFKLNTILRSLEKKNLKMLPRQPSREQKMIDAESQISFEQIAKVPRGPPKAVVVTRSVMTIQTCDNVDDSSDDRKTSQTSPSVVVIQPSNEDDDGDGGGSSSAGEDVKTICLKNLKQLSTVVSAVSMSTMSTCNTVSLKNIVTNDMSDFSEEFEYFDSNVRRVPTSGTHPTKSESNLNFAPVICPKSGFSTVRKTQSIDDGLKNLDVLTPNKLKSLFFKPDVNLASSDSDTRPHQQVLNDLIPDKCQMGEQVTLSEKGSPVDLPKDEVVPPRKENEHLDALENEILQLETVIQNETKMVRQKQRLSLPQVLYKNKSLNQSSGSESSVKPTKTQVITTEKTTTPTKPLRKSTAGTRKVTLTRENSPASKWASPKAATGVPTPDGAAVKKVQAPVKKISVKKPTTTEKSEATVTTTATKKEDETKQKGGRLQNSKWGTKQTKDAKTRSETTKGTKEAASAGKTETKPKTPEDKHEPPSSRPSSQKQRKEGTPPPQPLPQPPPPPSSSSTTPPQPVQQQQQQLLLPPPPPTTTATPTLSPTKPESAISGKVSMPSVDVTTAQKEKPENTSSSNALAESPASSEKQFPLLLEVLSEKPPPDASQVVQAPDEGVHSPPPSGTECVPSEPKLEPVTQPDESEKPAVKSVWALTKVLLYEDGTKKFEILEASLTPPEYNLKNENLILDRDR